jgi:hypothetical protein
MYGMTQNKLVRPGRIHEEERKLLAGLWDERGDWRFCTK